MRCLLVAAAVVVAGCGGGRSGDGDPAAFCDRLDRLTTNDPFLAFGDRATAADIEVAFDALVERAREIVKVAPPDARGAANDYAEAADRLERYLSAEC